MPAHVRFTDADLPAAFVVADDLHLRRIWIDLRHLLPGVGLGAKGFADEVAAGLLPDGWVGSGPEVHLSRNLGDGLALRHRLRQRFGELENSRALRITDQRFGEGVDMAVPGEDHEVSLLQHLLAWLPAAAAHFGSGRLGRPRLGLHVGPDVRRVLGHRAVPIAGRHLDASKHGVFDVAGLELERQSGGGDPLEGRLHDRPWQAIAAPREFLAGDRPIEERHDMVPGIDVVHQPLGQERPVDARLLARSGHVLVDIVVNRPAGGQRQRPPLRITIGPHRLAPDAFVEVLPLLPGCNTARKRHQQQ